MTTPMDRQELVFCLNELRLGAKQAAKYLSLDPKTVNRWLVRPSANMRGAKVPGPAAEAIRAWVRFQKLGLPWRPNEHGFINEEEVAEEIRLMREHVMALNEVMKKVKSRGGVSAPWIVDLERHEAVLADVMRFYFYLLPNGSFSPSSYTREDRHPDFHRDLPLLEDAMVAIAEAIAANTKRSALHRQRT